MGFEIPQLNSCCCGCTLKTGTKIIGWLQLITAIISLVVFVMAFIAMLVIDNNPNTLADSINKNKNQFSDSTSDMNTDDAKILKTVVIVVTAILIVMFLLYCILAIVLLMGVYQHKPNLVYKWVIISFYMTIMSTLLNFGKSLQNPANIGSTLIGLAISLYFILVVHSYYRTIRNQPSNA